MTNKLKEINNILSRFAPVDYGVLELHEDEERVFPHFIIIVDGYDVKRADNIAFYKTIKVQVEHYFKIKNIELEEEVAKALEEAGFVFSESGDSYENEERMYVRYIHIN